MNNLMLTFVKPPHDLDALRGASARRLGRRPRPCRSEGRVIELPVVYGGDGGPHMADVVAHTGLSVDEIVELHSAPVYPVYALGSHPGLLLPGRHGRAHRHAAAQGAGASIPGGAVSIGGAQTGVSASAGPSGWNTIGSTRCASSIRRRTRRRCCSPATASAFGSRG